MGSWGTRCCWAEGRVGRWLVAPCVHTYSPIWLWPPPHWLEGKPGGTDISSVCVWPEGRHQHAAWLFGCRRQAWAIRACKADRACGACALAWCAPAAAGCASCALRPGRSGQQGLASGDEAAAMGVKHVTRRGMSAGSPAVLPVPSNQRAGRHLPLLQTTNRGSSRLQPQLLS